jgi:two-component sensor histidine kinase
VVVEVEADGVELSIDRAVPLGLILNEAARNSVKHAFGDEGGRIKVKLTSGVGHGEAKLTIRDNGRGYEKPGKNGSGLRLISSLAAQVGGELRHSSTTDGTEVTVTFPVLG